jgi:hypothetical protein
MRREALQQNIRGFSSDECCDVDLSEFEAVSVLAGPRGMITGNSEVIHLDVKRPNRRTGFLAADSCGLRTGNALASTNTPSIAEQGSRGLVTESATGR